MLTAADWPGNIRQLHNVLEQCCALCTTSTIPASLVARALRDKRPTSSHWPRRARHSTRLPHQPAEAHPRARQRSGTAAGRNRTEVDRLLQRHGLTPALFKDRDETA